MVVAQWEQNGQDESVQDDEIEYAKLQSLLPVEYVRYISGVEDPGSGYTKHQGEEQDHGYLAIHVQVRDAVAGVFPRQESHAASKEDKDRGDGQKPAGVALPA